MDARAGAVTDGHPVSATRRSYLLFVGGAVIVAAVLGFALGSHGNGVATMSGNAYVGDHVASIKSGDRYYGVRDSVAWFDASGSFHEDGWPDCLGPAGSEVGVRFGALPVTVPGSGLTFYDVAYIDCRGA